MRNRCTPTFFSFLLATALGSLLLTSCTTGRKDWYSGKGFRAQARLAITVTNSLGQRRLAAPVLVRASELPEPFRKMPHLTVVDPYDGPEHNGQHAGLVLPSQQDDLDGDGVWDELAFQVDLSDLQVKTLHLYGSSRPGRMPEMTPGTDATVSETHHLTQLVLESERITYSVSDAAALDAIGKLGPSFNIGYYFGERKRSPNRSTNEDHGLDFVPVGTTLGAASFCIFEDPAHLEKYERPWTTNSLFFSESDLPAGGAKFAFNVIAYGPVRTVGQANVTNWLTSNGRYEALLTYSLWAKRQDIQCRVELTSVETKSEGYQLGLGFRQVAKEEKFDASSEYAWATAREVYSIASGGIIADQIGLSLIYDESDFESSVLSKDREGNRSHLIVLKGAGRRSIRYTACAGWNRDEAVQSPEQWEAFVRSIAREVKNPVAVKVGAMEE